MLRWVNVLSRLTVTAMLCAVLRKRDKYLVRACIALVHTRMPDMNKSMCGQPNVQIGQHAPGSGLVAKLHPCMC